jgi:DNA-directed RNA polymerase subunit RPC12/RpoP
MQSYTVKCPTCGKTVTLEEEVQEIICPYCGAKFAVTNTNYSGHADSVVLYEATQVVNQMLRAVNKYHEDCLKLYESAHKNVSNPFKRLLAGTDPFAMSEIHNRYFQYVDNLVKELDGHLSSIHDTSAKSGLAKKAVESILEPAPADTPFQVVFNYEADDTLSQPLLKHLTENDLRDVYDAFATPQRSKFFYPNQKKLAELMEYRLGIEKKKGLAALIEKFKKNK